MPVYQKSAFIRQYFEGRFTVLSLIFVYRDQLSGRISSKKDKTKVKVMPNGPPHKETGYPLARVSHATLSSPPTKISPAANQ